MKVGQKVQLRRLRDRVPPAVISKLGQTGTIRDFRMVDSSSVGVLVEFDDKFATWFFEDEIEVSQ
ncbi:DUF2862 domain-containing protein [Trichocoleus sp. FACHB-591]|uniref:cytochrome b6f subunit PetP n=1 Tax=Trichocoleus TaxID=450526 RepID=UPI001687952E|nr:MULTISPECIES: DUF2862 domain-containing protein [unclassified Trichocoleus]MBD2098761.1 DUF2862 domain-containing protein [Trichocoleus sp. FACHB-591]MBD2121931.1 DUF2862 domain-containing protein [Trichocoleus sp. FACHB-262]